MTFAFSSDSISNPFEQEIGESEEIDLITKISTSPSFTIVCSLDICFSLKSLSTLHEIWLDFTSLVKKEQVNSVPVGYPRGILNVRSVPTSFDKDPVIINCPLFKQVSCSTLSTLNTEGILSCPLFYSSE